MYSIYEVLDFNGKEVRIKTKSGHSYRGHCNVYCELNDNDSMEEYITIDGGLCVNVSDLDEIKEIEE